LKKQSFLQGALILMVAGLINRIMGFILRIILVKTIGDEGLGLFQMIYPLFMTLLLIATAGFPLAISKLIPERLAENNLKGAYNFLKVSLVFVGLMAIITSLFFFFSLDYLSTHIYSDERVKIILLSMLPALLISPLAACFRGFFQGMHTMLPTAASQITEQLSRFLATLVLVTMLAQLGLRYQAAGIGLGIAIGETSGFLLLIILFAHHLYKTYLKNRNKDELKRIFTVNIRHNYYRDFKKITALAVPVTLGKIINSLMLSGQAVLIPRQLQSGGLTINQATSLYGQLSGMVEQLIFLPTIITIALTTSLIPSVSADYANNRLAKIKNNYQDVIRISCYLGLPVSVIFFTRGKEICSLLFGYPQAGNLLAALAFSATFIYYLQVSHGMLNALGKPGIALLNLIIGSAIKLMGIYYLTPQESGIYGAIFSIGLGYIMSAILNFTAIGHLIGYQLKPVQCFIKPLFSSFILLIINSRLYEFQKYYPKSIQGFETIISLFIMIIIYLGTMLIIRAITPADLARFQNRNQ